MSQLFNNNRINETLADCKHTRDQVDKALRDNSYSTIDKNEAIQVCCNSSSIIIIDFLNRDVLIQSAKKIELKNSLNEMFSSNLFEINFEIFDQCENIKIENLIIFLPKYSEDFIDYNFDLAIQKFSERN